MALSILLFELGLLMQIVGYCKAATFSNLYVCVCVCVCMLMHVCV